MEIQAVGENDCENVQHRKHYNISKTVGLIIFKCLNFREFLILGLFTNIRIHEFSFFFGHVSSTIIIIIFARFLNSRI